MALSACVLVYQKGLERSLILEDGIAKFMRGESPST